MNSTRHAVFGPSEIGIGDYDRSQRDDSIRNLSHEEDKFTYLIPTLAMPGMMDL